MNEHARELESLLTQLRRTKHARRRRGVGVLVGCAALGVTLIAWPARTTTNPGTLPPVAQTTTPTESPAPVERPRLIVVSTTTEASRVERISDDTLLELLNTGGRRTGLIERAGEVILEADWLTQQEGQGRDDEAGATPPSPTA